MSTTSPTVADRVPPHVFFVVSAVLHYLGPSFAVLLFAQLAPSGVAWLRIATAGAVFAVWPPWRFLGALPQRDRAIVVSLGVVLAAAVGVGGFVIGGPVRVRSAHHATTAARQLRTTAVVAADTRGVRWRCGAAAGAVDAGSAGCAAGDRWGRAASEPVVQLPR